MCYTYLCFIDYLCFILWSDWLLGREWFQLSHQQTFWNRPHITRFTSDFKMNKIIILVKCIGCKFPGEGGPMPWAWGISGSSGRVRFFFEIIDDFEMKSRCHRFSFLVWLTCVLGLMRGSVLRNCFVVAQSNVFSYFFFLYLICDFHWAKRLLSHKLSTRTNQNPFELEQKKFASCEKFRLVEIRLKPLFFFSFRPQPVYKTSSQ